MKSLGFDLRTEANLDTLTVEVVQSAAIEGETLNSEQVRSSITRRLGIDMGGLIAVGRDVEGIVEVVIDATRQADQPLSKDRLFGWHAALFSTGRSGMRTITVGGWRPESVGAMQVVSGPIGREWVHFEAPDAARLETEIADFLAWFDDTAESDEIDPFIKAAIAQLLTSFGTRFDCGVCVEQAMTPHWD
jgi:Fic family protein